MISNLAYAHPDAKIGAHATGEPFAYIAGDVVIGDDCWIGPGAVIHDGARIGNRCRIHTAASVSCLPQDLKFAGEITTCEIGDDNDIRRMLPHRPPFLLMDRIFHRDETDVAGIKNVTMNEPFFVGHFPEEPVMPGVLIVEAMAQCSGILVLGGVEDPENYSTYFMKIDGVKFKRKVVPGDTLQFEIHLMEPIRRGVAVVEAKAFVGETLACEAVLMAQVVKNKNNK